MKYCFRFVVALMMVVSCTGVKETKSAVGDRILDRADILTPAHEDSIFSLIDEIERGTGAQLAVVTIDTLIGRDINAFSLEHAQLLNPGREKQQDGLLISVALKNRRVRIEVGHGLSRIITDETAARIIERHIAPAFRRGQYGSGIYAAVDTIRLLTANNSGLVGKMPY